MRVQQPATAPTDNFALLGTAPFNKAPLTPSRRRVCSDVLLQFTPSSEVHAPSLLQPAAAPLGKSSTTASYYPCRAIRFSSATRSLLQHSPLTSVEHISATKPIYVRSSTATTTTTPSTRRHPTAPFGNAAPPTNSSSAITSL